MASNKPDIYRVQINYKSGISVMMDFEKFSIKYTASGGIQSVTWMTAYDDQRPMYLNADAIESVFQIKKV